MLSEDSSGGVYRHTFTYDDAGNRLTRDDGTAVTTWTYDDANRMETADDGSGVTTYAFDATGNQELIEAPSGDLTTYAWTFENQMSRIERPDATLVTYTWAPVTRRSDEFRISRETDTDTVNFLWDAENILRETDGVGTVEAQYTFSPQPHPEPYSALISQRRDTESSFYHFDGLGSTRALTDTSETETDSYAFRAFGEVDSSSGTTENPFAWVGQKGYYNDSESGLYSLRRRDYGSGQGRFVSEDPLGPVAGDSNLYRYVVNNAVNDSDPSGLDRVVSHGSVRVNEGQGRSHNATKYFAFIERDDRLFGEDLKQAVYLGAGTKDRIRIGYRSHFCSDPIHKGVVFCKSTCTMSERQLRHSVSQTFPTVAEGDTRKLRGKNAYQRSKSLFFFLAKECQGKGHISAYEDESFTAAAGTVAREKGCGAFRSVTDIDLCGLMDRAKNRCGSLYGKLLKFIDVLPSSPSQVLQIFKCLATGASEGVMNLVSSLGQTGLDILKKYFASLNLDLNFDLSKLLGGDFGQLLTAMGLGAKQMVDLAVEKGRKVMGDAFSRWEPMIVRAASLLESVFTNGLDKTLENLGSAASDKLAELKTAMRSTWHEMSSDFKGFLLDQLSSVVPGLLKSALTSLTPLKFINLLDVLVKLCETAGDFLDRVTGSIKEARECGPRAIGKIAGHTKAFVGEAAPKALGAILNVLVGNLPRQMVARKTQMFTMKVAADTSTGHGSIGTLPSLEQKQESRRNTGWLRKVDRTGLHFLAEQNPFPGLSVGGRRGESGNRLPPLLHKLIDRGR